MVFTNLLKDLEALFLFKKINVFFGCEVLLRKNEKQNFVVCTHVDTHESVPVCGQRIRLDMLPQVLPTLGLFLKTCNLCFYMYAYCCLASMSVCYVCAVRIG